MKLDVVTVDLYEKQWLAFPKVKVNNCILVSCIILRSKLIEEKPQIHGTLPLFLLEAKTTIRSGWDPLTRTNDYDLTLL